MSWVQVACKIPPRAATFDPCVKAERLDQDSQSPRPFQTTGSLIPLERQSPRGPPPPAVVVDALDPGFGRWFTEFTAYSRPSFTVQQKDRNIWETSRGSSADARKRFQTLRQTDQYADWVSITLPRRCDPARPEIRLRTAPSVGLLRRFTRPNANMEPSENRTNSEIIRD